MLYTSHGRSVDEVHRRVLPVLDCQMHGQSKLGSVWWIALETSKAGCMSMRVCCRITLRSTLFMLCTVPRSENACKVPKFALKKIVAEHFA